MMAIEVNWQRGSTSRLDTPEQVDEFLDTRRAETAGGDGLTMMIVRAGEGTLEGPMMEVGVNGDKGYVVWNDPPNRQGVASYGGEVDGFVYYMFQGQQDEHDAKREIDYSTVKQAVREFMASDGAKPNSVPWDQQPV
jgi:hypothetical protein